MNRNTSWLAIVVSLLGGAEVWASGPMGIYARIDEVTIGREDNQATWVLVKGDFLFDTEHQRKVGPARGYLCFSLERGDIGKEGEVKNRTPMNDTEKKLSRIEWDDLQKLVKEKEPRHAFVTFGKPYMTDAVPKVREKLEQAQENQIPYPLFQGLKMLRVPPATEAARQASTNPPLILQEYQIKKDAEEKAAKDGAAR